MIEANKELEGLKAAIDRAEFTIGILLKEPLNISNVEKLNQSLAWLNAVVNNLKKEKEGHEMATEKEGGPNRGRHKKS